MRASDIIAKKRDGHTLTAEEIRFFINGYAKGDIPDYQASAWLMAAYLNGLNREETVALTLAMRDSGDTVDLSGIEGVKVDKHSTGGVGDKTTLIVAPIVAACGLKMAKMSGRGLGHTGGTVDKLESITGYKTTLEPQDFAAIVNRVGVSVIGQSGNLAPADKKLYALRDVTATVDSIPLIVASIMSKKLAAGADCILLDVKCGSGAFMKTEEAAEELAQEMVEIGNAAGKKTAALITDMDVPLGRAIGNALEVIEAVDCLKGKGPDDLYELCESISATLVELGKGVSYETALCEVRTAVESGAAVNKFYEMVIAQGGDTGILDSRFSTIKPLFCKDVLAKSNGYIAKTDTEQFGVASLILGAGRTKKEDAIDYSAGIVLHKKTGDAVCVGEPICTLYTNIKGSLSEAERVVLGAITINDTPPAKRRLIIKRIV